MKFKHISKNQVFKNDVITVFEETLALPNENVVTWTFTGKKEVVAIIAELENEIESTERELSKMIDELEGNEFDMLGLAEFKKLLGGE